MKTALIADQPATLSDIDNISRYLDEFSKVKTREDLIQVTHEILENNLPTEYTGFYIWDKEAQKLLMLVASGFTEEERIEAEATAMDRHVGKVFKTGIPLIIDDTQDPLSPWSLTSKRSFEIRTRVVLPVKSFHGVVGVLSLRGRGLISTVNGKNLFSHSSARLPAMPCTGFRSYKPTKDKKKNFQIWH